MNEHTRGPWHAVSASALAELPDMMEIAEVSHMRVVPASGGWPKAGTPEDDARLIAAAPAMYEYIASSASNGCAEARRLLEVVHGNA